jgi:hypothetical protein
MASQAHRALILSGLVYPGVGQIVLKNYTRGMMWSLIVTLALVALLVDFVRVGVAVIRGCETATSMLDVTMIPQAARSVCGLREAVLLLGILGLVVLLWGCAAVDAYFLGRRIDRKDHPRQDQGQASV